MKDIMKGVAEANGFGFDFGRSDFHGLFDKEENKGKVYVFLDPYDWTPNENDMGDPESITFSGSLVLGLSSSIDEISFEGRYDDYVKSLAKPAIDKLKESFKCGFNTQFVTSKYSMIINYTQYNFDGLAIDYAVKIDMDKLTLPDELGLELEAQSGGIVEPYEGVKTYPPLSRVAINAVANDGYTFQWWLINGAKVLDRLTSVSLNQYKKAIAYFIRFFTLNISSVGNGSTIPATGSYKIEEGETVQIEAIPDENNQFVNFDDNGTIITDNPYFPVMDSLKNVVANFSEILQVIQKVFTTKPIQTGFGYGFENLAKESRKINLVVYGNSIAFQTGAENIQQWTQGLQDAINESENVEITVINEGYPGNSGLTLLNEYDNRIPQTIDPLSENWFVTFEVVNDLIQGATDQECYDHLKDICLKANNDFDRVFIATAICSSNTTNSLNTRIPIVNQMITDDYSFADGLIPIGETVQFSQPHDDYYYYDGTHPSYVGYRFMQNYYVDYMFNQILGNDAFVNVKNNQSLQFNDGAGYAVFNPSFLDISTSSFVILMDFTSMPCVEGTTASFMLRNNSGVNVFDFRITGNGAGPMDIRLNSNAVVQAISIVANENNKIVIEIDRENDEMRVSTTVLGGNTFTYNISALGALDVNGLAYLNSRANNGGAIQLGNIEYNHFAIVDPMTQEQVIAYITDYDSTPQTDAQLNVDFDCLVDNKIFDSSVNNQEIDIVGITTITDSNVLPTQLARGATLYTDGVDIKAIAYKLDGTPQNRIIAGFNKINDYPAGSGILKGLNNIYDGVQVVGIETDATFEDINSLENSSTIEIIKDENTVSNLIIKA